MMDRNKTTGGPFAVPVASADATASPTELGAQSGTIPFYLPTWGERARLMGWRWIYVLLPILLVGVLFVIPWSPLIWQFAIGWWKLLLLAISIPVVAFMNAAKNAIRNRKDPFCIHCGYSLTGLPAEHDCPECGRPYSHRVIEEYQRDPHWFIERHRNAGSLPSADVPFMAGPKRSKRSRDGT